MFRFLTVLMTITVVSGVIHAAPPSNGIFWETDLLKARARAIQTKKPILIVFGAEWCTFCKKMESTTLSEKEMIQGINDSFVPVHLDFDKSRSVAKALEVKGIPSSIVLSTDAVVLSRKDGFAKSEEYRKVLTNGLKAHQILLTSGESVPLQ